MLNLIYISIYILILIYIILILISFDPSDPGWMQLQSTWNGSICNTGGMIGAKTADFLFFCFGSVAYTIPIIICFYIWILFIKKIKINIYKILITLTIILTFFILFCGLAHLIFDDIFYFSPGGIIGIILYDIVKNDHDIILDLVYVILFIGIIICIQYYNKFFLFALKRIQKKIIYFLNTIYILFSKQNNQQKQSYKQAYFNVRITPSVFSLQKNNLFKKMLHTPSKICEKTIIWKNLLTQPPKQFNLSNTYLNKIKLIPSKHNTYNQNKNITTYRMTQIKFNTNYSSRYNANNKNSINQTYCKNKKNMLYLNKNIKKIQNKNDEFFDFFQKQTKKHNVSTHKSYIDKKNLSNQQKKIILINQNKNQFKSFSKKNNYSTPTLIHKTPNYHNKKNNSVLPDINLLITNVKKNIIDTTKFKKISQLIEKKLSEYHIKANVAAIVPGPVITRFDLNLSAGIKSSKISHLSRDLARSLSVISTRVIEIVPGTPYVGLEIPNKKRDMVYLGDIINSDEFQKNNSPLTLVLGKDTSGQSVIEDLKYMPHLLVAGTTGSGKSIGIHVMIISILYKSIPENVRFIMIDPKILELSIYSNIPHLLQDIVTNTQDAESTLEWCIKEMERRYKLMSMIGVRNLDNYNNYIEQLHSQKNIKNSITSLFSQQDIPDINHLSQKHRKLPYIIIIIDEFSDLMMTSTKKVEVLIIRLTQKARAAGIHIILATQRPSVDVVTGVIKANIPARIAFTVSSKIDSRTILGQSGAESLLGMGDMLYLPPNSSTPIRIHGACITDKEIHSVVDFWKKHINL